MCHLFFYSCSIVVGSLLVICSYQVPMQCPNYGPNWPDLVGIRTFLGKLVRKLSELVTKSLTFTKIGISDDPYWAWILNIYPWHERFASARESRCETFCKEGLILSNFWSDFLLKSDLLAAPYYGIFPVIPELWENAQYSLRIYYILGKYTVFTNLRKKLSFNS